MAVTARVDGVELEVSRLWSRRALVRVGGRELPKDAQGHYELRDRSGRVRRVDTTFDWRQFGPRLRVGDTDVLLGRPIPGWVRVAYLVFVVVSVGLAGAVGGLLALGSVIGSAALLRRQGRRTSDVLLAVLLPVAAVVAYVLLASVIAGR